MLKNGHLQHLSGWEGIGSCPGLPPSHPDTLLVRSHQRASIIGLGNK
jgi:hypothetical protein